MVTSDLYEHLEENTGRTVQISGYAFRTKNFKSNEFIVGSKVNARTGTGLTCWCYSTKRSK